VETFTLKVEQNCERQRVDKFLADNLPLLTRTRIQALIDDNRLVCNGKIITSTSQKVHNGEIYILSIPPLVESTPQAENIALEIFYEDDDILVLNKPAGMVVHPAPGHGKSTLVNALLSHCKESLSGIGGVRRPGIVHRLDKETSGLMVIAKNDQAHHGLCAQFSNRSLSRTYMALVWGIPTSKKGTIQSSIGRSPQNRKKMAIVSKGGKSAITHYAVVKSFFAKNDPTQAISMVQCTLETGRTHQIRVHLTHLGHPIVGDPVYGRVPKWAKKAFPKNIITFPRQALHACILKFLHPRTHEPMTFEAPLPLDIKNLLSFI